MKETAQYLRKTVEGVLPSLRVISNDTAAFKPNPSKWSKKEILGHLIDSACNNQQKFVRAMAEPHVDFVGYAQDFWVAEQKYQKAEWRDVVIFWVTYNFHIAHIIENVNPNYLNNTISINGSEPFTLKFIMTDYVEHVKHHLKQVLPDAGLESTFENVYNA